MKYPIQGLSDQLQTQKATLASGVTPAPKKVSNQNQEMFGNLFRALMSHEVVGAAAGEVSEIYGTLRSTPRTDNDKLFTQQTSTTSRVKGVKEEYHQEEHHNFQWMIEEAKKLKALLEKFEDILANQGAL